MALFDLKKLKESVQKSVTEVSEKLPDSVKNAASSGDWKEMAQMGQNAFDTLRAKGEEALASMKEKQAGDQAAISEALKATDSKEKVLTIRDTLRLIYCLMAVDGTISDEEIDKVTEIGRGLDPQFEEYEGDLLALCKNLTNMHSQIRDKDEYYDLIHDEASNILSSTAAPGANGIRAKVLIWDLLAVAYSEGDYSTDERRLIRYISKNVGVEQVTIMEMEHTIRTLMAIEQEETWLRNSNRSYAIVESHINELADRRNAIMRGVNALLLD